MLLPPFEHQRPGSKQFAAQIHQRAVISTHEGAQIMSGKRANIFGQGKPERPYEERDEEAAEVPQRATAAQLATRK
jgi:hypothetical protein